MNIPFRRFSSALFVALAIAVGNPLAAYDNFKVAVYCRAREVSRMTDTAWLDAKWKEITSQVHVDKVYIETHRDQVLVDEAALDAAKKFFRAHGVAVAGGITFTVSEPNRFETFSYSNPEHRAQVRRIAEYTAKHFDEFILDDFFFTSTKSEFDIAAKGSRSWTDYRLDVMVGAARDLVIGPAKAVNPAVKIVIKYPNWYDHFQSLGFNLADGPGRFDGIYTGTETRDAVISAQHLQPYLGYNIVRYFENLAPGRNGGGWVDPYASRTADRYAEQLWLTLFAHAREITLFNFADITLPVGPAMRAAWQGQGTSFDFAKLPASGANFASIAGLTFAEVDKFIGKLGRPIGLKSYKPFHSGDEAFLQNFLGMAGLPMDIVPEFPTNEPIVLLTAQAAADPAIIDKIESRLRAGGKVVITSGFVRKMQGTALGRIAEIEDGGRVAAVKDFTVGWTAAHGDKPILIPQIVYRTNDSWELVSATAGDNGWPLLHDADYAKGHLYVLAIPENFADFSEFPAPVLNAIRAQLAAHLPVQLEAPGKVSLFVYDNNTFIVESFCDEPVDVGITANLDHAAIEDLLTGEIVKGETINVAARWTQPPVPHHHAMRFKLAPHSYRVFSLK
ncbi:MAG TPA: hypothetical protein VFJ90_04350 [Candidatus Didemnitutus sp.]|nr:hypothetical protein [Candidatus Didemnitutus sp.]